MLRTMLRGKDLDGVNVALTHGEQGPSVAFALPAGSLQN